MCDNLQNMIASHGPGEIKDRVSTAGIVHLLAVRQDQALSGRDTPNQSHVMLLAATGCTRFTGSQGFGVGETKAPENDRTRNRKAKTN